MIFANSIPMIFANPDPDQICQMLRSIRTIAVGIPRLWLQDGVIHEGAAQRAQAAGITAVMNRCMWRDYSQLCGEEK